MPPKVVHKVTSRKSLEEIEKGINEAAARHQFGVLAIHDLKQTMEKKGIELSIDCRIYEVCNPRQAQRVLEADGTISTALPCRISVYGKSGKYTLATMLPTEMMKGFDRPEVAPVAEEVEEVLVAMMNEAAGTSA